MKYGKLAHWVEEIVEETLS